MKKAATAVFVRVFTVTVSVLLFVLLMAYGAMWIVVNGPSPTARELFVLSVKETSAGGFLADMYLSQEEIAAILGEATDAPEQEEVDTSEIQVPPKTDIPVVSDSTDGIEVVDVQGSTYNGKMLIISDPTRVFVGVPDRYGYDASGLTVAQMVEKYDALAGTNAGGFVDPNGTGTGGVPDGIVIYEGEMLWGSLYSSYNIAGLDENGILYVGSMTGQRAMELGIQYAASYGPTLVLNGKPCNEERSLGGGLNPRTVIGQRADGAILLLVINGRSLGSLGATYDDLCEIMMSFGAVNATNMDGGSSSLMMMNGENLTSSSYIFGERVVATAILVRR